MVKYFRHLKTFRKNRNYKTFLRDKDLMEIPVGRFMDYYELVVETKERLLDDIHNKISITYL